MQIGARAKKSTKQGIIIISYYYYFFRLDEIYFSVTNISLSNWKLFVS